MISSSSKKSISRALRVCRAVAAGDFEARLLNITETGELGELMRAINLLIDRTDAYMRESKASMDYVSRNRYFRLIAEKGMVGSFLEAAQTINRATGFVRRKNEDFLRLGANFEQQMKDVVEKVSGSVDELQDVARNLTESSKAANTRSATAAAGAQQASANMSGVATATEQLTTAIDEINRQVAQSSQITAQAVTKADQMGKRMDSLAGASSKIDQVVQLINDIAGQTNLLALNATIESARAGEAGKGFAVVAAEVKALAAQTEKATGEIRAQIDAIQSSIRAAVEANAEISGTVSQVNDISTAIAAAIEQQGDATREIARNVQQAASGTSEVSSSITHVQGATEQTEAATNQVLDASQQLGNQQQVLQGLRTRMEAFLGELRKVG